MQSLELKIPPLALVIIVALLMWLSSPYLISIALSEHVRLVLLVSFALLGSIIIGIGALAFKQAQTTVNPTKPETSSSLVNIGIFSVTRNPMYVGMVAWLIGWLCFLASPLTICFIFGFILYMNRFQIIPEERILTTLFKQDYIDYCAQVRRWL